MMILNGIFVSCGSDEWAPSSPPLQPMYIYGEYIKDVEGIRGALCNDSILSTVYIEDTDSNRYYIAYSSVNYFPIGCLVEFEGKIYAINKAFLETKEHLKKLSKDIDIYVVRASSLSIELVE